MLTIEFLRQFRLGDYAVFDFAVSFLGIYLISPLLSKIFLKIKIDVPKKNWIFLTVPLSVLIHLIFGVITPMTRDFIDIGGNYLLKVIILGFLYLGLRGIRFKSSLSNDA